jgi:mannose-1-phosphate guanylyltransferase
MYVVILAGGSGTRFWPLSRASMPKQLISVTGGQSMLQRTVERVLPLRPDGIIVVTNAAQAEETSRQLEAYRSTIPIDVIREPFGRNTAPAVGLAATIIAARDPDAVMLVLPADHHITDEEGFRAAVQTALPPAAAGSLVTMGIEPTRPETGFGYIQASPQEDGGVRTVTRFVEKPPLDLARHYLTDGNYYWNSGIFIWRADVVLDQIALHMPRLASALARLVFSPHIDEESRQEQINGVYGDIESQSIDYGIMEHSDNVMMVPAAFGWSDVGSWSALPEVLAADAQGNVIASAADSVAINASGNVVHCSSRLVALVGVDDLVVVDTGDALLITRRDCAQDVRKVVDELSGRNLSEYL